MRNFTLALILATIAHNAQAAIYCDTDAKCFSKALSLVKRATKAGCQGEAEAIVASLGTDSRVPGVAVENAEKCIESKKSQIMQEKAAAKRLERIKAALKKG